MKNTFFLLIVILFCCSEVVAQNNYHLNIETNWDNNGNCFYECPNGFGSGCPYNSCTAIEEFYINGIIIYDINDNILFTSYGLGPSGGQFQFSFELDVLLTVRPYRILYTYDYLEIIDIEGYTTSQSGQETILLNTTGICFDDYSASMIVRFFEFSKAIEPLTVLNNTICNEESFFLTANNDCFAYDYFWKYSTDGTNFTDLGEVSAINLASTLPSGYTGNLFIKADVAFNFDANDNLIYNEGTNTVIYNIISCSPQLLSFTPINTNCSYSDDGSFSMILDREIPAGKKLVASLFYEFVTGSNNYSLLAQKDTTTLIDNGNNTFTYNWPSDTPILAGKYKVRYQTYDTTATNPVWDSLEGTEDGFTIGNPPAITFTGTKLNDVYCNNGSDGVIQLNALGGVGSFKYELNNSGSWIPFSSSNTHNIIGLPEGTKTIKVQDANGCTQQE